MQQKLIDKRLWDLIRQAAVTQADPNSVEDEQIELVERLVPIIDLVERIYFRLEVEGLENIPVGKALLTMNHEAGISFAQTLGLGARFYLRRGTEERLAALMHDQMFKVPYLGNLLGKLGVVRGSHENAMALFEQGRKIVVAPGGNLEAFRPYKERYKIKFGGHKGWARLALRAEVPVVPVVFIGGQETFFVLRDGQRIVKALGLKRWMRISTFPLFIGLPWGLALGPLFHLPLPSKSAVRILEPITIDAGGPEAAEDLEAVDLLYRKVTMAMQRAMDEMAAKRQLPVLG